MECDSIASHSECPGSRTVRQRGAGAAEHQSVRAVEYWKRGALECRSNEVLEQPGIGVEECRITRALEQHGDGMLEGCNNDATQCLSQIVCKR